MGKQAAPAGRHNAVDQLAAHLRLPHRLQLLARTAVAQLHLLQRVQLAILRAACQQHSPNCGRGGRWRQVEGAARTYRELT